MYTFYRQRTSKREFFHGIHIYNVWDEKELTTVIHYGAVVSSDITLGKVIVCYYDENTKTEIENTVTRMCDISVPERLFRSVKIEPYFKNI
jgi:hypothetical protein